MGAELICVPEHDHEGGEGGAHVLHPPGSRHRDRVTQAGDLPETAV